MSRIEHTILRSLMKNETFARKTLPYIKEEYFHEPSEKLLFNEISEFITKYNNLPSNEILLINIEKKELNENIVETVTDILSSFSVDKEEIDEQWLIDNTEEFCQEKAVYNALRESIQILDDKSGKNKHAKGAVPKILQDALGISFDSHVGHDYLEDSDERFEYYHQKEQRIPFDLEFFNTVTKNGVGKKTLNIILAGTNVGKSLVMCHFSAAYMAQGLNVLYITMEMSEENLAKRIDANCLNINIDEIEEIPKSIYNKKMDHFKTMTKGKLVFKEYSAGEASVTHFRALLNELKLKKNFKPDVIVIDYLNLCASSRLKKGATTSYEYIKAVAEELRGLAKEANVPVWSATQTTRSGSTDSDPDLTATSESFGLPATADFMFAAISTEELEALGQYLIKQLKNRYNRKGKLLRFVVGVDYEKMRLYDVEQSAQEDIVDDKPVMSNSKFGERDENERKPANKFKKFQFTG